MGRTMENAWLQGLLLPKSDDALARALRVPPRPMPDLHQRSVTNAGEQLKNELRRVFHPSAQDLAIVRQLAQIAAAYAEQHYACPEDFLRWAQTDPKQLLSAIEKLVLQAEPRVTFFTGPAGVGKSTLAAALARVLNAGRTVCPSRKLGSFPLRPVTLLELPESKKVADQINEISRAGGIEPTANRGDANDLNLLNLRLYQTGSCLLMLDELQGFTSSATSNLVTRVLLGFRRMGRPLVFLGNYELGHRLKTYKGPEVHGRLLANPIVMLPDAWNDPAFVGYLGDIAAVIGVVKIDFELHASEIHVKTFGLRRYVRRLFTVAYEIMRTEHDRGRAPLELTIEHLRAAHDHKDYGDARLAVKKSTDDLLGNSEPDPRYRYHDPLPDSLLSKQKQHADWARQVALNAAQDLDFRTREERERQEQQAREHLAAHATALPTKSSASPRRKPQSASEWRAQQQSGRGR